MKGKPIPALLIAGFLLAIVFAPVGQRAATSRRATFREAVPSGSLANEAFLHPKASPTGRTASADASEAPSTPAASEVEGVARVTNVSIHQGIDGKTVVEVGTTRPVEFQPFHLTNPVRLVVDLQRTETSRFQRIGSPQPGILKDVRVAQFCARPSLITRVVADLAANIPSRVEPGPHGVRIQLQGNAPPAKVMKSPPSAVPRTIAGTSLKKPGKRTTPKLEVRTPVSPLAAADSGAIDLTRPVNVDWAAMSSPAPARAAEGSAAAPGLPRTRASHMGLRKPPTEVALAAVIKPDLPQAQRALHAAQVMSGSSQSTEPSLEKTIISTPAAQQAAPVYTGKLISVDFKALDIRDFFRLIHRISGLNIVVDSDVTGKITLVLDDVPWDQALDLVLKNNDLGKVFEGNVLRIAKVQTLTSEAQSQAKLRTAKLESEPLVTVFRRLKYAHVADQMPSMGGGGGMSGGGGMGGGGMGGGGSMGGGGGMGGSGGSTSIPGVVSILKGFKAGTVLSARGNVVADPRDNALIITDVPSQLPVIESVVSQLDTKAKQVSIQARVILASATFSRTLGTVLGTAFRNQSGSTQTAAGTGQGIVSTANLPSPLPPLTAITQQATVSNAGFGAFAISNASARYAINAAISAAEEHDQARTISRPTIVTQDNVLGTVQQGVQVPIQTDINNTIAIQYVNATLMLAVTPQVTVDDKVFLNIYVNNASIGTVNTLTGPSINTQQATTQVMVPNGGTVVFGGITVTTRGRTANYIPLLGSIPVIGNLFKSSTVNDQTQELLFFVTPTVLPG